MNWWRKNTRWTRITGSVKADLQLRYGGLPETGLQLPRNPATTEDEVVLVEHAGLPWGDGALRAVKANGGAAVFTGLNGGGRAGMIVPNARGGLDRLDQFGKRDPVAAFDLE